MTTVLFVCLRNAGRSRTSQALFERGVGGAHGAPSAGTTPAERVHRGIVEVMRELGDLSDCYSLERQRGAERGGVKPKPSRAIYYARAKRNVLRASH